MTGDHWGEYARKTVKQDTPRPLLLRALEHVQPGVRRTALDLGSGSGNDTLALLGRGWTVTALDASAEALEVVRARAAPDAPLTLMNAPFHRPPRRRYGLVYASLKADPSGIEGCPQCRWNERSERL